MSAVALLCQADQSRSRSTERKSRPRHLDDGLRDIRGVKRGYMEHVREGERDDEERRGG